MPEDSDDSKSTSSHLWTRERIEELKASGEWFADKRWRDPFYEANSPFTAEEHEQIFKALERVYTPARARRVVRKARPSIRAMPPHQPPLFDPWAAHASFAVSLGADLAVVKPWTIPNCRDMLNGLVRDPENFAGARLELAVHAALLRAAVPVERGVNIDLRAHLGAQLTLIEIRYIDFGDGVDQELGLLHGILFGWGPRREQPSGPLTWVSGNVALLPAIRDVPALFRDEKMRRDLRTKVLDAAQQLSSGGGGSTVVDGLVRVEVGPGGDSTYEGSCPPPDVERETKRLWGVLDNKSAQVKKHAEGDALVWLDIGTRLGSLDLYVPGVQQWLARNHGAPGQRIIGVVLVGELLQHGDTMKVLRLLPHPECPVDLGPQEKWDRISEGLNWYRLRCAEWRLRRASENGSTAQPVVSLATPKGTWWKSRGTLSVIIVLAMLVALVLTIVICESCR